MYFKKYSRYIAITNAKKSLNRDSHLESITAFLTDDKDIIDIINMCYLFPFNSWKCWTDYQGNYIKISNRKNIKSVIENIEKDIDKIVLDIYFKAPPQKISNISGMAFISFGKDDHNQEICFIWFLGMDERLRLLSVTSDGWNVNRPPLSCGLNTLRPIIKYFNTTLDDYCQADILRVNGPVPAKIKKSWVTKWPPSKEFKDILSQNAMGKKIITDCGV